MTIGKDQISRRSIQFVFQLLTLVIGKIIFLPVTKRKLFENSLSVDASYLILSNHKRSLDPFVIICGLPYRQAIKLLPIGFMTANFFYDSWLRPLCWLAGCFPARNPKGKHKIYGVEGSSILLQNGFSVFVFP